MGNLLTSLFNSAGTMRVLERALSVTQNNVANASTPGYAKQVLSLSAKPFQPASGLAGGVDAGDIVSYRDGYAEQAVRQQNQSFGRYSQKAADLAKIEPVFPVTEDTGIPAALNEFFESASSLSVAPNDASARQVVIDRAGALARSFNQSAASLATASAGARTELVSVVDRINGIAKTIAEINFQRQESFASSKDAGLDAQLQTALEDLSELVNFTSLVEPNGSVTVLLGDQTPIVMGSNLHPLTANASADPPTVLSETGRDATGQFSGGRLASLIDLTGKLLPGYAADLNRMAASVADSVNEVLRGGVDANGDVPTVDLFSYDAQSAASSLAAAALLPDQLAAALPGAPGGNGNALKLAALDSAKMIDGYTGSEYYGKLAGRVGRELADARSNESVQQSLVAQARTMRGESSGVSLDEEAASLMAYQRAYQAAAKMFSALDEMTQTVINLIR